MMAKNGDGDDKPGYWGVASGGLVAHWWADGERIDRSLCGVEMHPMAIGVAWGRRRCKRCVRALVASQEGDSK